MSKDVSGSQRGSVITRMGLCFKHNTSLTKDYIVSVTLFELKCVHNTVLIEYFKIGSRISVINYYQYESF